MDVEALTKRLREGADGLRKMAGNAIYSAGLAIRVKDPAALIADLEEAEGALVALSARAEKAERVADAAESTYAAWRERAESAEARVAELEEQLSLSHFVKWRSRAVAAEAWRDQFDCCMCGSRMDDHDIGSNHSPVSMYDYYRSDAEARATALAAEVERLRKAVRRLLACPAIADGNHNEPAWADQETAEAERIARAALEGKDNG